MTRKRKSAKATAKMLADVVRGVAPIYEKHGKQIAGIVLPKDPRINPYCGNCGRDLLKCQCPMPVEKWPKQPSDSPFSLPSEQPQETTDKTQEDTCP